MAGVMRVRSMALLLLISLVLITSSSSTSFHTNTNYANFSSPIYCHPQERTALLGFLNSMAINYSVGSLSHDLQTWKKGDDCCSWDGVTCDPTSHHVVELDLSNSGLVGTLDSNSSLFHLHHLRFLYLYENDFSRSTISPMFGSNFPFLEYLYLGYSNFSGEVPLEISKLSKLRHLDLFENDQLTMKMSTFHGIISNLTHLEMLDLNGVKIDSTIPPSLTNLSSLTDLDLSNCNLRGEFPAHVLNFPQLKFILLGGNKDLYANFPLSNWSTSLEEIDLSNVDFSSKLPQSSPVQYQSTQLYELDLRGCNFYGKIPDWVWSMTMRNDTRLDTLDLSDNNFNDSINLNGIHSKFPNLNVTSSSLGYLNISHNYLTGRVTSLPWNYLETLDMSNNMFNGPLPIPPLPGVNWFSASNNNFTGPLPSSLCNLTSLGVLDLSNNNLEDEVPHCLGNLYVLNLGSNTFSGSFPDATFSDCSYLKYLDLSLNLFQGLVPRLLARCQSLEVLNLRSNNFLDEFPHWLGTLSQIRVLDLSNNGFFGLLQPLDTSSSFSELQVLDLSNNNLSGKIPSAFLERFKAMMNITPSLGKPEYMKSDNYFWYYYYSITLTFNGGELKYKKIITTLTTFDLSNNKFEGVIPNSIGKLVSLHGLNLSHNQLVGPIPTSLGNLSLLNSLDLSFNKLTGKIPQELASLSSLGVFRVSNNQLEGPIPNDNHFETFPVDSYEGNPGLCGIPLPKCAMHGKPRLEPSKNDNEDDDVGMMSEWQVVMMGCGFGTFVSFVWGCYMLSIGRPLWLLKLVLVLVDLLEKRLFGRRRRRPTKGRN